MPVLGSAVGLLVLSPLALVTNVVAVVVVCHYRAHFHGTDVGLISLLVSMATRVLLAVPIPAALDIHGEGWLTSQLCSFYVWLTICLRVSELLVTCVMNIHWMCLLRQGPGRGAGRRAVVVKALVAAAWFVALVTGLSPVLGASFYRFYSQIVVQKVVQTGGDVSPYLVTEQVTGYCSWLPAGIGRSFLLLFLLLPAAALLLSVTASGDTLLVMRHMRRTALRKYRAGRFHLPPHAVVSTPASTSQPGPRGLNTGGAAYLLRGEMEEEAGRERRARPPVPPPPLLVETEAENRVENEGAGGEADGGPQGENESRGGDADSRHTGGAGVSVLLTNGRLPQPQPQRESPPGHNARPASRTALASTGDNGWWPSGYNGSMSPPPEGASPHGPAAGAETRSEPTALAARTVHAHYQQLSLSSEMCRVVLVFTLLAALLHHLPFAVLQFVQLVQEVDERSAERAVLWLGLLHSLAAPHVLWALSRRYRHALRYTWAVHVLGDRAFREHDASSCVLQSYIRSVVTPNDGLVKVVASVRNHSPVTRQSRPTGSRHPERQPNGNAPVSVDTSLAPSRNHVTGELANGLLAHTDVITTDHEDGLSMAADLTSHRSDPQGGDFSPLAISTTLYGSETASNFSKSTSPIKASPCRSQRSTRGSTDIKRSSSTRKVWKEQMIKKHLPVVFVNKAFEVEETLEPPQSTAATETINIHSDMVTGHYTTASENAYSADEVPRGSGSERKHFHYYMHGDFHHDYLYSDSLLSIESESEGGSFQYDDHDIEGILDRNHSPRTRHQHITRSASTFSAYPQYSLELPPSDTVLAGRVQSHNPSLTSANVHQSSSIHSSAVRSSSLKSESPSEGSGSGAGRTSKKPLRLGNEVLEPVEPTLQHKETICIDLGFGEDMDLITKNDHVQAAERKQLEDPYRDVEQYVSAAAIPGSSYPEFEAADTFSENSDLNKEPQSPAAGSKHSHEEASDTRPVLDTNFFCHLPGKSNSWKDDFEDAMDIDTTLSTPYLNLSYSALPALGNDKFVFTDTDDVFIFIKNVTSDETFTDDGFQFDARASGSTGNTGLDTFTPRKEDSVLEILAKTDEDQAPETRLQRLGTRDQAPETCSDNSHESTLFSSVLRRDSHAAERLANCRGYSPIKHNFFPEDLPGMFETDYPVADPALTPKSHHKAIRTLEVEPKSHHQAVRTLEIESNVVGRGPHAARLSVEAETNDVGSEEWSRLSSAGSSSRAEAASRKDMITRVDGDVMPPDKAGVVLALEETSSNSSTEVSMTLEPYGDRRPPWLDTDISDKIVIWDRLFYPSDASSLDDSDTFESSGEFGHSSGSNTELGSIFGGNHSPTYKPLAVESFIECTVKNENAATPQTGGCLAVPNKIPSPSYNENHRIFDDDIERGFEDALSLEYVIGNSYLGKFSRFESIEEEPENFVQSGSSTPKSVECLEFRTMIVSKPSSRCSNSSHGAADPGSLDPGLSTADLFNTVNGQLSATQEAKSPLPPHTNPFSQESELITGKPPSKDSNKAANSLFQTAWEDDSDETADPFRKTIISRTNLEKGKPLSPMTSNSDSDLALEPVSQTEVTLTNRILARACVNGKEQGAVFSTDPDPRGPHSTSQAFPKPIIRLTRPSPWPKVENRSNSLGFESDFISSLKEGSDGLRDGL